MLQKVINWDLAQSNKINIFTLVIFISDVKAVD